MIKIVVFLFFAISSCVSYANECRMDDISFGFFNGVGNDLAKSRESLDAAGGFLKSNNRVLYYNKTHNIPFDAIEAIAQKLNEEVPSLGERFELYAQMIDGRGDIVDRITARSTVFLTIRNDYIKYHAQFMLDGLHKLATGNNTVKIYKDHQRQIDAELKAKRKVLLVAHSQGNLFMNQAYDYAKKKAGLRGIAAIHVAPATSKIAGRHYVLADNDLIIHALFRSTGGGLPWTDRIGSYETRPAGANNLRDWWGHGFQEIYLNESLPTSKRLLMNAGDAIEKMAGKSCDLFSNDDPDRPIRVINPKKLANFDATCGLIDCIHTMDRFVMSVPESGRPALRNLINSFDMECRAKLRREKKQILRSVTAKWNMKERTLDMVCDGTFLPGALAISHPFR